MTGSPVRVGLVGCGRLAEAGYVPAAAAVESVAVVAVADPDARRRAAVAAVARRRAPHVSEFPDAAALVADAEVDVVVVASPVEHHGRDAATCAAAGVPTLVEKPPAPDGAGARRLAALAPRPWIGLNRRFDLGNRRVRAAVRPDVPLELRIHLAYRRASWRAWTVRDDALLDLGPHVVDLARWLTGDVVREVRDAVVEPDRARATLVLDRGRAAIEVACDRPYRELVEVRDRAGGVVARHALGGPVRAARARLRPGPHPLVASLALELTAVASAVRGVGRGALADAGDAVAVMDVIDAIRNGAEAGGRTVAVPAGEVVECS